jgi:hypothetical protein
MTQALPRRQDVHPTYLRGRSWTSGWLCLSSFRVTSQHHLWITSLLHSNLSTAIKLILFNSKVCLSPRLSVSSQHCPLPNSKEIVHTAGRGRTNRVKPRQRTCQPRSAISGLGTTTSFIVLLIIALTSSVNAAPARQSFHGLVA